MSVEEIYGLNHPVRSFAISNTFVQSLNKVAYALGQRMAPFCFYGSDLQNQYGVLDLCKFEGFHDKTKTLVDDIADFRRAVYSETGLPLSKSELIDKSLMLDYLLTISICYIEIPKRVNKAGTSVQSCDKYLATRNPLLMSLWMDMQVGEMQLKYSGKISVTGSDFARGEIRFVRLTSGAKGNSITCPRNPSSIENMRCVPLFMSHAFMKGLEGKLNTSIVRFDYEKDNGDVREVDTSLSEQIIRKFYPNGGFADKMLHGADVFGSNQGGMGMSSTQSRGYVRVPELGSSVYDLTGVRALNLARILRVSEITESDVDTTYINVDLSSCVASFNGGIDVILRMRPEQLGAVYGALTMEGCKSDVPVAIAADIKAYVLTRESVVGTPFLRMLHLFMVRNPEWFPSYTGAPNATTVRTTNYGVM